MARLAASEDTRVKQARHGRRRIIISPSRPRANVAQVAGLAGAAAALLLSCAASNVVAFLTEGNGLDLALIGATVLTLSMVVLYPTKHVSGIASTIILFLVIATASAILDSNPFPNVFRALTVVTLALGSFFFGFLLNSTISSRVRLTLSALTVGLVLVFASLSFIRESTAKNLMSGTIFELSIFYAALMYRRKTSALTHIFVTMMIAGGALLFDHRAMLGIAVIYPLLLLIMSFTKLPRLAPPMLAAAFSAAVVLFYTSMSGAYIARIADEWIRSHTGRTAYSGRQVIWSYVIARIDERPLLGWGPSAVASPITGLDLSTHNAFLQAALNYGYLGLGAIAGIFFTIAVRSVRSTDKAAGVLLSTYLSLVIIHNTFENVLLQNNFPIAVLTWTNIGALVALCSTPVQCSPLLPRRKWRRIRARVLP